jgi:hypothetical protein
MWFIASQIKPKMIWFTYSGELRTLIGREMWGYKFLPIPHIFHEFDITNWLLHVAPTCGFVAFQGVLKGN